jgi:hypothetical protein
MEDGLASFASTSLIYAKVVAFVCHFALNLASDMPFLSIWSLL